MYKETKIIMGLMVFGLCNTGLQAATPIIHDAEYYILEKQNIERWSTEDKDLDKRLAEFKKKNGDKPPNIFYILIDDIGFGDLGSKTLNAIRGYKTPNINKFAREGMRLARMYTEPSCNTGRCIRSRVRAPPRINTPHPMVASTRRR